MQAVIAGRITRAFPLNPSVPPSTIGIIVDCSIEPTTKLYFSINLKVKLVETFYHHLRNSAKTKSFHLSNDALQLNLIHKRLCEIDDRMIHQNLEFYKNVALRCNQEL